MSKHERKREARPPRLKQKGVLESNDFSFIYDGVSNMDGDKRNEWYSLSRLLQTY